MRDSACRWTRRPADADTGQARCDNPRRAVQDSARDGGARDTRATLRLGAGPGAVRSGNGWRGSQLLEESRGAKRERWCQLVPKDTFQARPGMCREGYLEVSGGKGRVGRANQQGARGMSHTASPLHLGRLARPPRRPLSGRCALADPEWLLRPLSLRRTQRSTSIRLPDAPVAAWFPLFPLQLTLLSSISPRFQQSFIHHGGLLSASSPKGTPLSFSRRQTK